MNYALLFMVLVLTFILVFKDKKQKPRMTNQIETEKAIFSFFEDHRGKKMLQTLFKSSEPELFSVYVSNRTYERTVQGKGSIKKLYQKPHGGFVHYSNPVKKISRVVKIDNIDLPDNYNPFNEVDRACYDHILSGDKK